MSNRNVPDAVQFDRDTTAIEHMHDLWQALGGRSLPTVVVHLLALASEQFSIAHCTEAAPREKSSAAGAYASLLSVSHQFIVSPPVGTTFASPVEIDDLVRQWIATMPATADDDEGGHVSDD